MNDSGMPSPPEREAALFALALEKPVAERAAFLQAVCGSDGVLRQRLETLLAAHDQPDELLGNGVAATTVKATIKLDLADELADEAVGRTIWTRPWPQRRAPAVSSFGIRPRGK